MKKFLNTYRIPSARAPFWDYSWNAAYFVTICTRNRICWFGDVADGEMVLSEIGKIVHNCWLEIPQHFPFVKLDSFIVMPNHVHGIIVIDNTDDKRNDVECNDGHSVETQNFASLRNGACTNGNDNHPQNKFGPQSKNLASIVRGFKIGVTKFARAIQPDFSWQPRYYDIIIRDDNAFQSISRYILNNPVHWSDDCPKRR